jgi:predicted dehydrogenase
MPNARLDRRAFLKRTAQTASAVAAAAGAPLVVPASALGLDEVAPPSERIRMGLVGCGNHGVRWNLRQIFRYPEAHVVAVCDVDAKHLENGRKAVDGNYAPKFGDKYKPCDTYKDFRELITRDDIDAVANCTPDHWHVIPAMMAAKCEKDVICEKPLTLFVEEGRRLSDTVAQHDRVFQTASENRSLDVYLRLIELVRGGVVGDLTHIEVRLPIGNSFSRLQAAAKDKAAFMSPQDPPEWLDYQMWLGQAPMMPYIPARLHGAFRWNLAFSGGVLTDWGAHMIDLAQWGHDTEHSAPVEVEGQGDFPPADAVYNTAPTFSVHYKYADGCTLHISAGQGDLDPNVSHPGKVVGRTPQPGIRFEGTKGWIESHKWRGTLKASERPMLDVEIDPKVVDIYRPKEIIPRTKGIGGEYGNFLECIKTRKPCYAPAETGHRTITVAHIGNIAMMLGRKLQWDAEAERFVDDDEADGMLTREQREPWTMDNIDKWI